MKMLVLKQTVNFLYHLFFHVTKVEKNKITFCTNRSGKLNGNLKNIYLECKKDDRLSIKIITFNFERSFWGRIKYLWYSIISMYNLATSCVFLIDDYFLPIYCINNKSKENIVIQVWHAIGHLKKYGLSIPKNRKSVIKHHSNYDWVLTNSESDVFAVSEAFDIEKEKIIVTGAPRLDNLIFSQESNQLNNEEYSILYAPTYRNAKNDDVVYDFINTFISSFSEYSQDKKIRLYISLHPYFNISKVTSNNKKIEIFQDSQKSSELLSNIDCFVTDYSSLLLDFSYFEKPVKIFAPDYEEYIEQTGFYVDFKSYINLPFYTSSDDLMKHLFTYSELEKKSILKLKEDTFNFTDGKNSRRVYEFISTLIDIG